MVKNVAGYELTKLFVGSAGTLAVLTRARLRLRALPEDVLTLALRFLGFRGPLWPFTPFRDRQSFRRRVALLNPDLSRELGFEDWTLLTRFEGFREETNEGASQARRRAGTRAADSVGASVWDQIRDFPVRVLGDSELLLRGQGAPARIFALAESWQDGGPLVAYPDSGVVYSHTRDLEALGNRRETAALCGANTVLERAPSSLKNELDVFGEIPEAFAIVKRLEEKLESRRSPFAGSVRGAPVTSLYEKTLACVHCGLCLPACPAYRVDPRESLAPRGQVYNIRAVLEGRLEMTPALASEIYDCLACRGCESVCPSGVPVGAIVEQARGLITEKKQEGRTARLLKRFLLSGVLAHPRRLAALMALLRVYERSGLRSIVRFLLGRLAPPSPSASDSCPLSVESPRASPRSLLLRARSAPGLRSSPAVSPRIRSRT